MLQDAVKYLFKDFKKSIKMTRELDIEREKARDIQFQLLRKLCSKSDYKPHEVMLFHIASEKILDVAVQAEEAGDFIRELAVKYS